ncbi:hypothetical protein [Rhodococcus spelaei]|nr:hypothetical protein [Rhodococcus spelaei]
MNMSGSGAGAVTAIGTTGGGAAMSTAEIKARIEAMFAEDTDAPHA